MFNSLLTVVPLPSKSSLPSCACVSCFGWGCRPDFPNSHREYCREPHSNGNSAAHKSPQRCDDRRFIVRSVSIVSEMCNAQLNFGWLPPFEWFRLAAFIEGRHSLSLFTKSVSNNDYPEFGSFTVFARSPDGRGNGYCDECYRPPTGSVTCLGPSHSKTRSFGTRDWNLARSKRWKNGMASMVLVYFDKNDTFLIPFVLLVGILRWR